MSCMHTDSRISSDNCLENIGTLGNKRKASFMQHSRYLSSLKSAIVMGRSDPSNTRVSSSCTSA